MLGPLIFLIAFMMVLATTLLGSELQTAKAAISTSVTRYADAAMLSAMDEYTARLAAAVRDVGSQGPWPGSDVTFSSKPVCATKVETVCPFSTIASGRITVAPTGAAFQAEPALARNLQRSAIAERRVSAILTVTLTSRYGTALGSRTRLITYRVFEAPPYAVVSGVRDLTAAGLGSAAPGDTGGYPGAPPVGGRSEAALGDTRIHVQLTCSTITPNVTPFANDQRAPGNDGLPWGNAAGAAHEAPCRQRASEADSFADGSWQNGNGNSSGWTP